MNEFRKCFSGSVALGMVLASGSWLRADDEDHLAKAPASVQATVKKVLGKGKLEGFDSEQVDGKTAYDVDMNIGGTSYAMLISSDGEILQREVEVVQAMVPQAVIDAGTKAHADGKIAEASIITKGNKMFYELEMKVGKDEHDVEITAGGKVLADTVAAPEAKDSDEKDEKDAPKEKKSEEPAGKLKPDQLPAKVMESVKGRFPNAEITSAEKETEGGNVVYDLEMKFDGLKYESDIKEDGTIMEIEKEIKDVPPAVTKAVEAKYPKAKINEVMEVNKVHGKEEKPENYEVTIAVDGKDKEVIVALDGSSVKEEAPEPAEKK